jgi:CHASE3 domain sensor protein
MPFTPCRDAQSGSRSEPYTSAFKGARMVKALLEKDTLLEKAKSTFDTGKNWTVQQVRKRVVEPVQEFVNTVNGQQVLIEVREYMTESEAINTALVTRLLQAERQIRWLQALVAILAVAEVMHWLLR